MAIKENSLDTMLNETMDTPVEEATVFSKDYVPEHIIPFETTTSNIPEMSRTDYVEKIAKAFSPEKENLLYRDIYDVANDFMITRYGANYLKDTNMQQDFEKYRKEIAASYILKKQQQNENKTFEPDTMDIAKDTVTGSVKTAMAPIDWLFDPERAPEDFIQFAQTMGSGFVGGVLALPSIASNTVADIAYNIGSGFEPDYDKRVAERMKEDEGDWMDTLATMIDPYVPGDVRTMTKTLRAQNVPGVLGTIALGFKEQYKLDKLLQATEAYLRGDFRSGNRFISDFSENLAEKTYENPLQVAADIIPLYKLTSAFARAGLIDDLTFSKVKLTAIDDMGGMVGAAARFVDYPLRFEYLKTGLKIPSATGKTLFDFAKEYNSGTEKAIRLKKAMSIADAPFGLAMKAIEETGNKVSSGINFARNQLDFYKKLSQERTPELYRVAKAIKYMFSQKKSVADDLDSYFQVVEDSPVTKEWLNAKLETDIAAEQKAIQNIMEAGEEQAKAQEIKQHENTIELLTERKGRWAEGKFLNSDFIALHSNMMTLINRIERSERLKTQLSTDAVHGLTEAEIDILAQHGSEFDFDYSKFANESRDISAEIKKIDAETKPFREAFKTFTEIRREYNKQLEEINLQRANEDISIKQTIDNYEQLKKELVEKYKADRTKLTSEFATNIKGLTKKTKGKKLTAEEITAEKTKLTNEYKAKLSEMDEAHKRNIADYDEVTSRARSEVEGLKEVRNIEAAQLYESMTSEFLKKYPDLERKLDMARELKQKYKSSATLTNEFETAINVAKVARDVANKEFEKASAVIREIKKAGADVDSNPAYDIAKANLESARTLFKERNNEYINLEGLYEIQRLLHKNGYDMSVAEFFKNMTGTPEMKMFLEDVNNKRVLTTVAESYKAGNPVLDIAMETYRKYRKVERIRRKVTELDGLIDASKKELPDMTNKLARYLSGIDKGEGQQWFMPQNQKYVGLSDADGIFKDFNVRTNIPEWVRADIPKREYLVKNSLYDAAAKDLDTASEKVSTASENLRMAEQDFADRRISAEELKSAQDINKAAINEYERAKREFKSAEMQRAMSIYGQYEDIKGRYQAVLGDKLFEYGIDDLFESVYKRENSEINKRFRDYAAGIQTVLKKPISIPGGIDPGVKIQSMFPDAYVEVSKYSNEGKKNTGNTFTVKFYSKDKSTKFFEGKYEAVGNNNLVDQSILDYYYPGRDNSPNMTLTSMIVATLFDTYQSNLLFRTAGFMLNSADEFIKRINEIYEDIVINKESFMSEGEMAKVSSWSAIKKIFHEKTGLKDDPKAIDIDKLTPEQKAELTNTIYNGTRREFADTVETLQTGKKFTADETDNFIDVYSKAFGGVDQKYRIRNMPEFADRIIESITRDIADKRGNVTLNKMKLAAAKTLKNYQKALDVVYAIYGLPDIVGGVTGGKKTLSNYFKEQQISKQKDPTGTYITNMAELEKAFDSIALTDKNAESLSKLGERVRQYAKYHMDATDPVRFAKALKSIGSESALVNAVMSRTAFVFQSYPAMAMNAFINNMLIVLTGVDAWGRKAEAPERWLRAGAMTAANASAYYAYKNAGIDLSSMSGMGIGGNTAGFERQSEKEEMKKPELERTGTSFANALMKSIGYNNIDYFMNIASSNLLASSSKNAKQSPGVTAADEAFKLFIPGAGLANEAAFWLNGKRVSIPKTIIQGKEGIDRSTAAKVDNIWDIIFWRFKTEEQQQEDRYGTDSDSSAGVRRSRVRKQRTSDRKRKRR